MRVLVTGTDGYIGSLLGPFLAERGYDVVGLDTGFYLDGCLYTPSTGPFVTHLAKDIRQITDEHLSGFDAVVHLAELSNDPLGQLSPGVTYEINHLGTVALANNCKKADVPRFIYTSSCSVYGAAGADGFKTETSEPNPQTAYAHCKVLVEKDLSALADDNFSPTFLRNATAFGASPRMRFDIVLNNLSGLAWTTKEIRMTSNGSPWRPLVHVLDICEAIACSLAAPREIVHNQIFNVGNTAHNYRIREIAQIISDAFPGCGLKIGTNDSDNRSYRVSFDKINSLLPGFKCTRTAESGANELRELFAKIDMAPTTFEFRAFTRLKQIQHLIQTGKVNEFLFWN